MCIFNFLNRTKGILQLQRRETHHRVGTREINLGITPKNFVNVISKQIEGYVGFHLWIYSFSTLYYHFYQHLFKGIHPLDLTSNSMYSSKQIISLNRRLMMFLLLVELLTATEFMIIFRLPLRQLYVFLLLSLISL